MSNIRAEFVLRCNYCARPLSVTHFAQTIRCHQCNKINVVPIGENKNLYGPSNGGLHNHFKNNTNNNSPIMAVNKGVNFVMESISEWKVRPGKRALLCGVTYNGQKFSLKGAINDVDNMKKLLEGHFKFPKSSIQILIEDKGYHTPTKKNIQEAFKWLVKDCKSGDSLVFYFSGHGLQRPDNYEDERDGFNEAICPVDFKTSGLILDNEINDTIVRPLTQGVKLHAIIDACHSGTILDLPYMFNIKNKKWEDNRPSCGINKGTNGGIAISFSACEDHQHATDTTALAFNEETAGAMTYTFKKVIESNTKITYLGLLSSMHKDIKEGNGPRRFKKFMEIFRRKTLQEPKLSSSSQTFDVNSEFKM